jgi:hypothetical protein
LGGDAVEDADGLLAALDDRLATDVELRLLLWTVDEDGDMLEADDAWGRPGILHISPIFTRW